MDISKFSKENTTIGFYVIYLIIAGILYEFFPGNDKTPNFGVLMLYIFIPISLVYFMYHLIKHLYSTISYSKCLLIHAIVWVSIVAILSSYAK